MEERQMRYPERQRARKRGRRSCARCPLRLAVLALLFVMAAGAALALGMGRELLTGRRGVPAVDTLPEVVLREEDAGGGLAAGDEDIPWNLTLVNRWNTLPEDYELSLVEVEGGEQVDERVYEPLMEMLEAAREGNWGQLPLVVSGYRTWETQQKLYDEKIAGYRGAGYSEDEAKELAEQWVAVPGTSEHQLGFAVDINGATYDVYLWLQANSYKYGFIFRYPGDKTEITGVAQEVWHYRYVGVESATEIYEKGLCLEEYLEGLEAEAA